METRLAEVAFPIPLRRVFDYRVPPDLDGALRPGHRVWAPFGRRAGQMGIVLRRHEPEAGGLPAAKMKPLEGLVEPDPALDDRDLALAHWMADRYSCSLGEALFTVCPLGRRRPPKRPPAERHRIQESPGLHQPTEEQAAALARLLPALAGGEHRRFLLQGVSASGKTEVYRRVLSASLDGGRGALLLVPEIGLTPQMEDQLRGWFGDALEIWHSEMANGERWRVWRRAREGRARVIVGPRSALFLPVSPLGVIIVDEEHDPSYKQDNAPHYHARDAAEEKARLHGALLILGSATPSLETDTRARAGDIERILLSRRVKNRPFPVVRRVDMKKEGWYLSDTLVAALRERLERGEQSLLFLNRRGYSTHVECAACGWESRCPQCAVSLVLHRAGTAGPSLRCHTCQVVQPLPEHCPTCGGAVLTPSGRGTQRVAADIATLFPAARCLRWDRDAVAARHGHERVYRDVLEGRVDIIIGTQMIAQGHDFPNVTLVGVLDADRSLSFPDFRAAERTFQLLMQVAGRAGRAGRPGEVVIQTRHPDHYALRAVAERDFDAFAKEEIEYRREASYPPFTRMAHAVVRARTESGAEEGAEALVHWLEAGPPPKGSMILGPAPAFHRKKAGWEQWQVVLKTPADRLAPLLSRVNAFVPPAGTSVALDVDPEGMA
ncbi:MAG: primosomal protein N' [Elusimicrobia bacterium]|nr:primosomal protein N' [Elusimicrobiota bacterium]